MRHSPGMDASHGGTRALSFVLVSTLLFGSCAAAPFLLPIAFEFARNLFQTGLQNYGSKHRDNLSNLVNRLANPYIQGLPPMAVAPGYPGQPVPGQAGVPIQPAYQAQPGTLAQFPPGTQVFSPQTAPIDPNNPSTNPVTVYPGNTAPQGYAPQANPYGQVSGYMPQPGSSPYDPNNPYGTASTAYPGTSTYPGTVPPGSSYAQQGMTPYGSTAPYGTIQQMPYGGQPPNPYGTPGTAPTMPPYGSTSYANPYQQVPPNPYGSQSPYAGSGYPPQQMQPGYDPNVSYGGGGAPVQSYGQPQPGYGQQPQMNYSQPQGAYGAAPSYGGQPPVQQQYGGGVAPGQPYMAQPYGSQQYAPPIYSRSVDTDLVAVDVALIRQNLTAHGKEIVLMNDGDVLRDGGANAQAGDRFKLVIRTNCDCYLYIMSIDGSGWAEAVYPRNGLSTVNPVKKDLEYAFPDGPYWFSLDQVKGIETFFVVASLNRRTDLEESFAQIASETRPSGTIVAKVEEPPVIPRGVGSATPRGIITVKDESGDSAKLTPLSYAASQTGQDVTVTRWFKHE
ncbi:hypothetical protein W02_04620 [Nitrospira sp. KM1]|uniref:DUF4384 domain-containing protein n=1 Tax=Nitrospira sp. KM1 TaxID=1936990 RepID=UPI0013A79658|nr:DUF4384 domain-containing protein [Nitrospira sp. KM1]BCA53322.1 hypothetical protein W02_04620 [Nitrospira sp. KM1]